MGSLKKEEGGGGYALSRSFAKIRGGKPICDARDSKKIIQRGKKKGSFGKKRRVRAHQSPLGPRRIKRLGEDLGGPLIIEILGKSSNKSRG